MEQPKLTNDLSGGRTNPHLAAALADQAAGHGPAQDEPMFDRAMTRILTGLLPSS